MSNALIFAAIILAALGLGVERFVSDRNSKSDPLIPITRRGFRAGIPFFIAAIVAALLAWLLSP